MADMVFSGVTIEGGFTITPPPTVPGAPTIGTATATGETTATVAFTAPASDGGSTITSYTATSSPGSITGTLSQAGSGTITVTGLTSNTSYTFTVTATNIVGTSSASSASNSITTGATPVNTVAPVVSGTASVGQTLSTTDGTWTGTATITFTYQWQRNGVNISSATNSTYILVDADAGNPIRCVVTGTNAYGNSSANSNATSNVTSVPGAPTIGTATATGKTTATVTYTGSANTGYPASTPTYTATSSPGGLTGTGTSPITVSGLTSGTSYTFTVTATNSIGTSAASAASNSVTTLTDPAFISQLANGTTGFTSTASNYVAAASSGISYMSGGVAVSGKSNDWLLAAYNSSGAIQWQRTVGSTGSDMPPMGVQIDTLGNPHVFGTTALTYNGIGYVKYNSSGTLQFQRRLYDSSNSSLVSRGGMGFIDSSNNVYLQGGINNGVTNVVAAVIAKYNDAAVLQWQRQFGNTSGQGASFYTNGRGITVDSSGNVYAVGNVNDGVYSVIWKYNSSGTLQWQRRLTDVSGGSFVYSTGQGIASDSSGNVYATFGNGGYTDGPIWTVKYNTSGTIQWQRRLSPPSGGTLGGRSIAVDSSGFVYVLGFNSGSPSGAVIVKYDSSGVIQWQRQFTTVFNGNANPANQITVDNNGSFYLAISKMIEPTYYPNYYLVKLPDDGSKTGTYTVDAQTFTYAVSTFTESAGSLTDAAAALTSSTSTYTDSSMTLTGATSSFTSTTTAV